MNKLRFLAAVMAVCFSLIICSCSKQTNEIVVEHPDAASASAHSGVAEVTFVPEGYEVASHRTVYRFVYETEYTCEEQIAVLRIASTDYSVTNLSGYADTMLFDVYTAKNGREFEIESREGVYAVEWQADFGGKSCNISYVLHGGTEEQFKQQLDSVSAYFYGSEQNDK